MFNSTSYGYYIPDSAVVMSPVYAQRPDSLPVLPTNNSEPDTSFHMHNIAPRFKNKMRAAQGTYSLTITV